MILHLLERAELDTFRATGLHHPTSLDTEGFVHCTGDDTLMLAVANRFYTALTDPVVITLDESRLSASTRWEPPAPLPADWNGSPLFPHVYGPLEISAVTSVRALQRAENGEYVGYLDAVA